MLGSLLFQKLLIIFTFTISGLIRGYYEWKYKSIEIVDIRFGFREKFFVRFVGFCITLPVLIYLFTPWLNFAQQGLPVIFSYFGCLLMVLNLMYFYLIHKELGKNWSPILIISKDQQLITTGPYSKIRHPMYLSIFLHLISMWLVTDNWLAGILGLISFSISYLLRINDEEELMIKAFGEEYRSYMNRTGRLFPKL